MASNESTFTTMMEKLNFEPRLNTDKYYAASIRGNDDIVLLAN